MPVRYINNAKKEPAIKFNITPIFKTSMRPILAVRFPAKNDADAYRMVKELHINPNPVLSIPRSFENTVEPTARIAKKLPVVNP